MAIDLIELIRLKVTSIAMEGETTNLFEKENALNQFYPFLLSILSAKPDLIFALNNRLNPRLNDLFENNSALKNGFLEQVSGSAPISDIEQTLNASILPILGLLQAEIDVSDTVTVSDYFQFHASAIQRTLPNWATTFLVALGLGSVSTSVSNKNVTSVVKAETILFDDTSKSNKCLPIITFFIALAVLALLFKACTD